jgi:hypothetical protein
LKSVSIQLSQLELVQFSPLGLWPASRQLATAEGKAQLSLSGSWDEEEGLVGDFTVNTHPIQTRIPIQPPATLAMAAELRGHVEASADLSSGSIRGLRLGITSATARRKEEKVGDWFATLRAPHFAWSSSGLNTRVVGLLSDADLPLMLMGVNKTIPDVIDTLFAMERVELDVRLASTASTLRLDIAKAATGDISIQGSYMKEQKISKGAFLASAGPIGVGVQLLNGVTQVKPLVGSKWLAANRPTAKREQH